jgi:hypothetical protein
LNPIEGQTVFYTDETGRELPAIVTGLDGDLANLTVFEVEHGQARKFDRKGMRQGDPSEPRTFHLEQVNVVRPTLADELALVLVAHMLSAAQAGFATDVLPILEQWRLPLSREVVQTYCQAVGRENVPEFVAETMGSLIGD